MPKIKYTTTSKAADEAAKELMTPLKAIRLKCLDCCCGQAKEVRLCVCPDCPLFPFRFGKNPNRAGVTNNGSFSKNNGTANDFRHEPAEEG